MGIVGPRSSLKLDCFGLWGATIGKSLLALKPYRSCPKITIGAQSGPFGLSIESTAGNELVPISQQFPTRAGCDTQTEFKERIYRMGEQKGYLMLPCTRDQD